MTDEQLIRDFCLGWLDNQDHLNWSYNLYRSLLYEFDYWKEWYLKQQFTRLFLGYYPSKSLARETGSLELIIKAEEKFNSSRDAWLHIGGKV